MNYKRLLILIFVRLLVAVSRQVAKIMKSLALLGSVWDKLKR